MTNIYLSNLISRFPFSRKESKIHVFFDWWFIHSLLVFYFLRSGYPVYSFFIPSAQRYNLAIEFWNMYGHFYITVAHLSIDLPRRVLRLKVFQRFDEALLVAAASISLYPFSHQLPVRQFSPVPFLDQLPVGLFSIFLPPLPLLRMFFFRKSNLLLFLYLSFFAISPYLSFYSFISLLVLYTFLYLPVLGKSVVSGLAFRQSKKQTKQKESLKKIINAGIQCVIWCMFWK